MFWQARARSEPIRTRAAPFFLHAQVRYDRAMRTLVAAIADTAADQVLSEDSF